MRHENKERIDSFLVPMRRRFAMRPSHSYSAPRSFLWLNFEYCVGGGFENAYVSLSQLLYHEFPFVPMTESGGHDCSSSPSIVVVETVGDREYDQIRCFFVMMKDYDAAETGRGVDVDLVEGPS